MRKQAQEQAEHWRAYARSQSDQDLPKWRVETVPEGDYVEVTPHSFPTPPAAPTAPVPGEAPEGHGGFGWSTTPPTPAPAAGPQPPKVRRGLKAPKQPMAAEGADAHEMQALMEQMRAQMDEMRAQMQALREELQNAPQRQMR